MSQVTNFDVPTSPLTMSALAVALEAVFDALGSINRGATAPSNPFEGMLWWDSAAVVEILKRYTVSFGWVSILSVNRTSGALAIIGATSNPTALTLMQRDGDGLATVAAPTLPGHIALKSTVTADIATHDALATAHGAITGSAAANGDFTSGTVYWSKIGNVVTVSWSVLGHGSDAGPDSLVGFIPAAYRPNAAVYGVCGANALILSVAWIKTDGQFNITYYDWTGTVTAQTGANAGSVSYIV